MVTAAYLLVVIVATAITGASGGMVVGWLLASPGHPRCARCERPLARQLCRGCGAEQAPQLGDISRVDVAS